MTTETQNVATDNSHNALVVAIKNVFKFRKIKASEKQSLISDGISLDQIEEFTTEEGGEKKVTHVCRKALEVSYTVPSFEAFIELGEKGVAAIQTLINKSAYEITRKMIDSGEDMPEDLSISIEHIIDALTPTRKAAGKSRRVTNTQLGEVVKLFVQWCLDQEKAEKAIAFLAGYMKQRFEPQLMAPLKAKDGMIDAFVNNLTNFAADMSEAETETYSHVIELLTDNLIASLEFVEEEFDAADL